MYFSAGIVLHKYQMHRKLKEFKCSAELLVLLIIELFCIYFVSARKVIMNAVNDTHENRLLCILCEFTYKDILLSNFSNPVQYFFLISASLLSFAEII